MKILIVDDDLSSRLLLELFLADYGTCDLADNGREAIKAMHRAGLPCTKIIMITAKNTAKDILLAYHIGCEAYITKPFTRENLIQQIHQLGLLDVPAPAE